jgi:c-di-AMP phosphodiesterase-like protein
MENREIKWSWTKFIKGMLSKQFLAWIAAFVLVLVVLLFAVKSDTVTIILIVTWGVISVIWMLSEAWKKFIENGQLKVDASIGASAALKIDGAIDKAVEAVKK